MGRKGKKVQGPGLGRALTRGNPRREGQGSEFKHQYTTEIDEDKPSLMSMLDSSSMDDFLVQAAMSEQEFLAEKQNVTVLDKKSFLAPEKNTLSASQMQVDAIMKHLSVPRRPAWNRDMTADLVDANERAAFLEWRKSLADVETNDNLLLTPYEKNLQVWRQLWRVIERSDVVVQIVDARNPLLFRCADLEQYVHEVDSEKKHILLLNKSELLSDVQRRCWARYFLDHGIEFLFWSAKGAENEMKARLAEKKLAEERDALLAAAKSMKVGEGDSESDEDEIGDAGGSLGRGAYALLESVEDADNHQEMAELVSSNERTASSSSPREVIDKDAEEEDQMAEAKEGKEELTGSVVDYVQASSSEIENIPSLEGVLVSGEKAMEVLSSYGVEVSSIPESRVRMYSRDELYDKLVQMASPVREQRVKEAAEKGEVQKDEGRVVVGMVGYPNVGKSSTINVLFGDKKVSVSATPGKTKHFQTLLIGNDIFLCDCPGIAVESTFHSLSECGPVIFFPFTLFNSSCSRSCIPFLCEHESRYGV